MARATVHNVLYTEEVWANVNEENKELMDDFCEYLHSVNRADSTIAQYKNDLRIFFCWNYTNNKDKTFIDLSKREIARFQNTALTTWEWSPSRIRRVKATLSSLSNFIENILDDEYKDFRPIVRKIENPVNEPVREKTVLSDEDVQLLLDTLVEREEYEKMMVVALAAYSGRRKSELPRFKMSYFSDENVIAGSLYKTPEKIRTKGRGKNGKMLYCYVLKKKFDPYLELWREYREENGVDSEWLLYDPDNISEPINVTTIDSWLLQFERIVGKDVYAHSFRHYTCTALSEAGLPPEIIRQLFGWSDISLVSVYTDTSTDDVLENYFKDGEIVSHKAGLEDL